MGRGVGGRAGARVAEEPRAGLGGRRRRGRAGQRRHEGRRRLASDRHKHLSVRVEAQTLGRLLRLGVAVALSDRLLGPLAVEPPRGVLQVEDLHGPLLPDLVGHLVRVDPHAQLRGDVCAHLLRVQSAPLGGQLHHGVPRGSQVNAAEGGASERRFGVPVALKAGHQYPLQLLAKQVRSAPRQLVVQVGHDEVEGDLHLQMHGCTRAREVWHWVLHSIHCLEHIYSELTSSTI
ncbi:hypothetical protein EYF80_034141 [Liparis tanakae]|uniref:Uncharacterized protein n=1 Tax=Liparis tanakae TaxID=230148 RepID=A0A4Z2GR87_9TELE|nr:hypothetical protein EYF80_034141 [Liparis tanakae]